MNILFKEALILDADFFGDIPGPIWFYETNGVQLCG